MKLAVLALAVLLAGCTTPRFVASTINGYCASVPQAQRLASRVVIAGLIAPNSAQINCAGDNDE